MGIPNCPPDNGNPDSRSEVGRGSNADALRFLM